MTPPRLNPGLTTPVPTRLPDATTVQFLRALYGGAPSSMYLELRPFSPPWEGRSSRGNSARCWRPATDLASFAQFATRASDDGLDAYVGVALRRARGGSGADVLAVTALWAELDGSPSKKGNGCPTKEDAYARLQACAIAPSIIVDSGGGYHAYWLLTEPLQDADELRSVPVWNARVRELLRAPDGTYAGDDVGDLARILRVPGTRNYKRQNQPRPVQLLECDASCRYDLAYLDAHLPALPEGAFRTPSAPMGPADPAEQAAPMQLDPQRRDVLVSDAGAAWALAEGHRHFLPHPMARVLLQAGWPWGDIPGLIADIATEGGSQDADLRRASAVKELGQAQDRSTPKVGWPWLRQNAPEMAEALSRHLKPATDDLADLAAHVASLVGAPAVAVPSPTTPEKPAMPDAPATVPPPAKQPKGKLAAIAGDAMDPAEGRASERIYNLLRDRLAWLGRCREDARPYGGRKRSDGHRQWIETIALDGREAELWALEVVRSAGLALTETHRKVALDLLAAEARHNEVDLRLRYAPSPSGDAWLVDLGGEDWQMARIQPGRWSIEQAKDATFLRTACTLPYTTPETAAEPHELVDGLQALLACDEEITAQLACWMVQALQPLAPRMGLLVTGPQGSGKSTFARLARRIVDPATPSLIKFTLSKAKEVDYQTANVHKAMLACVAYSNVSSLNEAASDFLCGLITGDGHIARALYSNVDPVLSEGRRTLVVEGISIIGMGADLQDRLLHLGLPMRTDFEPEARFEARCAQWMPRIMGALFAAAASAMERVESIEERYPELLNKCRMRDAAAIYGAAAEALGYDPQVMLARLVRSRSDAQAVEAETDIVGQAVLAWAKSIKQYRTGDDLYDGPLEGLDSALQGGNKPHDLWPKTPRGFRSKLDRLIPGLLAKGLEVVYYRSKGLDRKACVTVRVVEQQAEWWREDDPKLVRTTSKPVPAPDHQPVVEAFLAAHQAWSFAMLPILMSGRIEGFESWVVPMREIALATPEAQAKLADGLTRRYPTVGHDDDIWFEGAYGASKTWAAWLKKNG